MEDERYLYALLGVTVGCYAGIAAIVGLLFYWFNPAAAGDCSLNVTVIVLALVVALVLGAASMHPAVSCTSWESTLCGFFLSGFVEQCSWNTGLLHCLLAVYKLDVTNSHDMQATNGSLFPAAVVSLYCTYLAYSALQSEPHDYQCNSLGKQLSAASGSTLALGMVGCTFVNTHLPLPGHAVRVCSADIVEVGHEVGHESDNDVCWCVMSSPAHAGGCTGQCGVVGAACRVQHRDLPQRRLRRRHRRCLAAAMC
jgi:Serine incorporator (Serinc)